MELHPLFSVAMGYTEQKDMLPLARKIFADNQDILIAEGAFKTNFCSQNPHKSLINEHYAFPEDVSTLKEVILKNAVVYLQQTGLYAPEYKYEVSNFWLNEMDGGGSQVRHSHYGYLVSGCFYVDMPQDCNDIIFYNPSRHVIPVISSDQLPAPTIYNGVEYGMSPIEGSMCFWYSTVEHAVPPKQYTGVRRCIPFDVSVNGLKD